MSWLLLLFPAFGIALTCKQISQGYVIGRNWKPWFFRDTQPVGFWAVITWGILWTVIASVVATIGWFT